MRALVRQVLRASPTDANSQDHSGAIVIEKLRSAVTRFAGPDGFTSLLRRAVKLAGRDLPLLHGVDVDADGRLTGMEHLGADMGPDAGRVRDEAAVEIAATVLELLVTFVGETLTLKLVRGAWPETFPGE